MSWRGGRGLGYWYSCLCDSCSVGSVLVSVSGHVIVMYVLCLSSRWNMCSVLLLARPACWSGSHHTHGSGTVGTFGVLEFNRFCFGKLGRRNPVICRVRELAEFSSFFNTLVLSLGWNCLGFFIFIAPLFSCLLYHSFLFSLIHYLFIHLPTSHILFLFSDLFLYDFWCLYFLLVSWFSKDLSVWTVLCIPISLPPSFFIVWKPAVNCINICSVLSFNWDGVCKYRIPLFTLSLQFGILS